MTNDEIALAEHMLMNVEAELSKNNHENDFIASLRDWFDSKGFLTPKQMTALKNFYNKL